MFQLSFFRARGLRGIFGNLRIWRWVHGLRFFIPAVFEAGGENFACVFRAMSCSAALSHKHK
jgi:hypothetical protein